MRIPCVVCEALALVNVTSEETLVMLHIVAPEVVSMGEDVIEGRKIRRALMNLKAQVCAKLAW